MSTFKTTLRHTPKDSNIKNETREPEKQSKVVEVQTLFCEIRIGNKLKFNPLKPELNAICYLLALLGAHHFLHVSRIRVKLLTLR